MSRRTLIVSVLAVGLTAWFLRGANLGGVWDQVRQVRLELLAGSFLAVVACFWARAIRWKYLLSPLGNPQFRTVFRTTVIGFGVLGLLPVRIGDVVRPYLLARQEQLSVSSALATIVMERVLDLVAVLALLAVYAWGFGGVDAVPHRLLRPIEISAGIAATVAVALLAVMWVLATHPERVGTIAASVTGILPGRLSHRVGRLAHTFSSGFAATRDMRKLLLAVIWSFLVWLAIAAQAWMVTIAFGIAMPYTGTFLLQTLLVLGVAVPTPGGVGSFHEAYRIGVTTFFGASEDRAIAAAIVTHLISYIPPVVVGLVFMVLIAPGLAEDLERDGDGSET